MTLYIARITFYTEEDMTLFYNYLCNHGFFPMKENKKKEVMINVKESKIAQFYGMIDKAKYEKFFIWRKPDAEKIMKKGRN